MSDTAARQTTPPRPTPKGGERKSKALTTRARSAANDAGDRIGDAVEANPLGTLAAGIAIGLAAGALLPKTKIEGKYLGALGAALNEGAITAARAAGDAGKAELTAAGLSKVGANEQVGKLLESLGGVLRAASDAAKESRRSTKAEKGRGKSARREAEAQA